MDQESQLLLSRNMVVHMEIQAITEGIKKCNVRIRYARIGKATISRPFNLVPAEAVIQEV